MVRDGFLFLKIWGEHCNCNEEDPVTEAGSQSCSAPLQGYVLCKFLWQPDGTGRNAHPWGEKSHIPPGKMPLFGYCRQSSDPK